MVILHSAGQMCNKIVFFVNALATALDCHVNVIHLFAKEIMEFSDLRPDVIQEIKVRCFNRPSSSLLYVFFAFLYKFPYFQSKYYDSNAQRCEKWRVRRIKLPIVLWNWYFRNPEACDRHHDIICAYLHAKEEFCKRPRSLIEGFRRQGDIIVGVHIRRGDYKSWRHGNYYFDDSTYCRFMQDFLSDSGCPERVKFVLVSNETVDTHFFEEAGLRILNASGLPQEDVIALSMCDFIMGPTSTFSWWAAYYGDKPLLHLTSAKDVVACSKFAKSRWFKSSFSDI